MNPQIWKSRKMLKWRNIAESREVVGYLCIGSVLPLAAIPFYFIHFYSL
jgi:hypothetical protein